MIAATSARAAHTARAGPNPLLKACGDRYPPAPAKTATAIAIPSAPPSWRTVVKVPDALPLCCGATWVMTALCAAWIVIDIPSPVMTSGGTICQ